MEGNRPKLHFTSVRLMQLQMSDKMAEGFSNRICGLLCLGHRAEFGPSQQ